MPRTNPRISWKEIRNYTEKFRWTDPRTQLRQTGFNPPKWAVDIERCPFFVKYITVDGKVEKGTAVCLKVYPRKKQRLIMFCESNEMRRIRDYLIMEVDGVKFVTH